MSVSQTSSSETALLSLQKAYDIVYERIYEWIQSGIANIPNLLVALLVITLFIIASKYAANTSKKVLKGLFDSTQITNLVSSIIRILVIVIGLFIGLEVLGLSGTVTSLLAGAGIVGLALGFAFQDLTENFIAGVAMGVRKPFQIGDMIESGDIFGKVIDINLRNTLVETLYGQYEIIPNKMLFRNVVTNFHATGSRRLEIAVGIPYAQDIDEAATLITDAINALDFVEMKHDTLVFTSAFGSSSIDLKVWFWIKYPNGINFLKAQHQGFIAIKKALDKAGISIPFPIRTLDFGIEGGSPLAAQLTELQAFAQRANQGTEDHPS